MLRHDGTKRSAVINGSQVAEDEPEEHETTASNLYIGTDPLHKEEAQFHGAISELRLWKRCLADDELAMELHSGALPDGLVRWLCLTDEDAENPDGTVRNHAPHGPESMRVTSDVKPEWTTRAALGESS